MFSTRTALENPTSEQLLHRRPIDDIVDDKGKVLVRAYHQVHDKTTANAIVKLKLPTIEVLDVNKYVEATVEQDVATDTELALLDIYRKIRPGDPATPELARNLLQSIFFDARRYDMAKVGRYKMNKKLGSEASDHGPDADKGRPDQHPALHHQPERERRHRRTTSTTWRTSASAASASFSRRSSAWASSAWRRSLKSA